MKQRGIPRLACEANGQTASRWRTSAPFLARSTAPPPDARRRVRPSAGMPCEMHPVDAASTTSSSAAAAAVTTPLVPPSCAGLTPGATSATTTAAAAAAGCVCLHRKRTLDTLRQRLAKRLRRARRHPHDVITGDYDVSDDADTPTGERKPYTSVHCFNYRRGRPYDTDLISRPYAWHGCAMVGRRTCEVTESRVRIPTVPTAS